MTDTPFTLAEALRMLIRFRSMERIPVALQAKAIGIDPQTLRRLLNGEMDDPQLRTLRRLAAHYGVSLAYFGMSSHAEAEDYLNTVRAHEAEAVVSWIDSRLADLSLQGQRNVSALLDRFEMAER